MSKSKSKAAFFVTLLFLTSIQVIAQQGTTLSPEVHTDRSVSFRIRAKNALEVHVNMEGVGKVAMSKNAEGVWSGTTAILEPDMYGYSIVIDGLSVIDPGNPLMKPNLLSTQSMVEVSGSTPMPWDIANVPHGGVHHHFYHSGIIGDDRDFYVYTPPGYDARWKTRYPVMYLLHGYSDDASAWVSVGRANYIMDNLIAAKKVKPMLVVMPLGYGAPEIVKPGVSNRRDPNIFKRNFEKFGQALLKEVIPAVERGYLVGGGPRSRAIVGLSMGGGESLIVGANHLETFSWVGSFSGAAVMADSSYSNLLPTLSAADNTRIKLLWIACGKDDFLIKSNHELRDWLKQKNVTATYVETSGAHTWLNWRRYLNEFSQLLFKQ